MCETQLDCNLDELDTQQQLSDKRRQFSCFFGKEGQSCEFFYFIPLGYSPSSML